MRTTVLAIMLVLFIATAQAKIYRWVDKNGSVHFSDKPSAENAQEIEINETGIEIDEGPAAEGQEQPVTPSPSLDSPRNAEELPAINEETTVKKEVVEEKPVSAGDYKITTAISTLGDDLVSVSGRIGSGPKCYDMSVVATAINENGLTAKIRDQVRKSSSFGSVTFKGTARATGDAEDSGFWKIDSVTISCNDTE